MGYIRAISTLGCPELDLRGAAELARRHGIDALEVRSLEGTNDLADLFSRRYGTPASLAAVCRNLPVPVVTVGSSLRLVGGTPDDRSALLALVPWAEALGARHLRIFDGGQRADDAECAEAVATWRWWDEQRAQHGWKIEFVVETHSSLLTAEKILRLAAAVPARILWDSYHTWREGGEDPQRTWQAIRPHVAHIHVKDSNSSRPGPDFAYVPPGEGKFPMPALRETLAREYTGPVSLEWEKFWHPELAPLETALASAARRSWW